MSLILLIDHEAATRDTILNHLQTKVKYRIHTADSAEEARHFTQTQIPDLLLANWEMPLPAEANNIIAYLKHNPSLRNTPSVIYTQNIDSLDEWDRACGSGVLDFIRKPIHHIELIARVSCALMLRQMYLEIENTRETLDEQMTNLDEMRREQADLMALVAHDLKSPLNKVQGLTQLMPLVGELNEEQMSYVKLINKVIAGGKRLIEDILIINEAEAHMQPLQIEPIDLHLFLEEMTVTHRPTADAKQQKLYLNIIDNQIILTDREALTRILDNLLSNAIKFTNVGKSIYVTLTAKNQFAQISVRDEGQGMTEADRQKMFRKFQKLSAQPTAGESSTGLGLSIIKTLVERLNGEIHVRSTVGVGTEFSIIFPKHLGS